MDVIETIFEYVHVQFSRCASRARRAGKTSATGCKNVICSHFSVVNVFPYCLLSVEFCVSVILWKHVHATSSSSHLQQSTDRQYQSTTLYRFSLECTLHFYPFSFAACYSPLPCYVHSLLCCVGGLRQGELTRWKRLRGQLVMRTRTFYHPFAIVQTNKSEQKRKSTSKN